jgi:hypothetical protein
MCAEVHGLRHRENTLASHSIRSPSYYFSFAHLLSIDLRIEILTLFKKSKIRISLSETGLPVPIPQSNLSLHSSGPPNCRWRNQDFSLLLEVKFNLKLSITSKVPFPSVLAIGWLASVTQMFVRADMATRAEPKSVSDLHVKLTLGFEIIKGNLDQLL